MQLARLLSWVSEGTEELVLTSGAPVVDTTNAPTSGNLPNSCNLATNTDLIHLHPTLNVGLPTGLAAPGDAFAIAFDVRFSSTSTTTSTRLFRFRNDAGGAGAGVADTNCALYLQTNGTMALWDGGEATEQDTNATPGIVANTWQKLIVSMYRHATSGEVKVWLDETLVLSMSGVDTTSASGADVITEWSGLTGNAIRIGGAVLFHDPSVLIDSGNGLILSGYNFWYSSVNGTGFTSDGDALDSGVWNNTGNIPLNTAAAQYSSTPVTGRAVTDGTVHSGPNGLGITETVAGSAYIAMLRIATGGATTHSLRHGKYSTGLVFSTIDTDVTLNSTNTIYVFMNEPDAGAHVLAVNDYAAVGLSVDGDQNLGSRAIYAVLITQVPGSGGTPVDADAQAELEWLQSTEIDRASIIDWLSDITGSNHVIAFENLQITSRDAQILTDFLASLNASSQVINEWLAQTNVDKQLLVEWLTNIAIDAVNRIEWTQGTFSDNTLIFESLKGILADQAILAEWTGSTSTVVDSDHTVSIEWLLQTQSNQQLLTDWLASITSDNINNTEWTGDINADSSLLVDNLQTIIADRLMLIEWAGSLGVNSDHTAAVEWLLTSEVDNPALVDWLSTLVIDMSTEIEWLEVVSTDRQILISNLQGVQADRFVPIEWAGALLVNSDHALPIEWQNQLNADQQLSIEHLNAVVFDGLIPVEFNQGIVSDQTAVIEWLGSIGIDHTLLTEWGGAVVVNSDHIVPIEWGSEAGSFVEGNVNVFKVDARGVVWRVQARGVSWKVKPR